MNLTLIYLLNNSGGFLLLKDDKDVIKSLTTRQRKDLELAFALCEIGPSAALTNQTLDESLLREPMSDIMTLDDWRDAGSEEGTYTLLPTVFHLLNKTALEAVNSPTLLDLVYLTGWIYACLLCIAVVFVWFYLVRMWTLNYYGTYTHKLTWIFSNYVNLMAANIRQLFSVYVSTCFGKFYLFK